LGGDAPSYPADIHTGTALGHEPRTDHLDGDVLRHHLAAIAADERNAERRRKTALDYLKPLVREARDKILARITDRTLSGFEAAHTLCDLHDLLIRVLYEFTARHLCEVQNPTDSEHLAIVATGGYGRGLLAPFSDLDLLFLRPFKRTAWGESVIELILLMLWDVGFRIGHAARSLDECMRLARQDMTVRTSLLEARFICGDAMLAEQLAARFHAEIVQGTGRDFIEAKLAERDARHRKQGESRYLVEPNIKDGKGGLRDLQTLYWIGKYLYGVDDTAQLVGHGVFTGEESATFHAAEAFLWEVRCHLHCLTGRAEERLSFDVQPEVANRMGYREEMPRRCVEHFMKDYFLIAKDVGDLTRIVCAALEEQNRKPKPDTIGLLPQSSKPRLEQDEIYLENGRLNARDDAFRNDPVNFIRIFHIAESTQADIHPGALRMITRSLVLVTDSLRGNDSANRLFLEILSSRHNPERALRRMNEAGVLAAFVPPFAHAVARMQFNMYHHYTVDEHLIRAVGNLAAIERGELTSELPLASELIHRIKSREALYCAVFLHDIGKGLRGNHSEIGAAIAQSLSRRWGLSDSDAAAVTWLVRQHLLMSDTAQRRDISDAATVRNFVREVQSPELLRMLLVLTVADIRAVGPGVWNGWKGQLLRELYHEADGLISGAAVSGRIEQIAEAKKRLMARLADWTNSEQEDAIEHFGENYWFAFDATELERNARLRAQVLGAGTGFALDGDISNLRSICEVAICTPDRPGLFFMLAGAIAACGGSIVEAKIFTGEDGYALDVFSVQDAEGFPFGGPAQLARLRHVIARTLAGDIPKRAAIVRRPGATRSAAFEVRPRVNFDNEASTVATVLELEGADRPGLLFEIARVLFELHLSISTAIVATYGERAVDVFYIRDRLGNKIDPGAWREHIETRLMQVLSITP
jgi:[protein-PII] uridylyltransferase